MAKGRRIPIDCDVLPAGALRRPGASGRMLRLIAALSIGCQVFGTTGCSRPEGESRANTDRPELTKSIAEPDGSPVVDDSAAAAEPAIEDAVTDSVDDGESTQSVDPMFVTPVDVEPAAERIYRPDDLRPLHNAVRAAELGIDRFESRRLLLYTDIDPEIARTLPPLMDQAYAALEDYFGPMPPARDGADYQMTGYIMADKDRFLAAGMLPERALESLVHGLHRGAEFWMNEQEYDYYRRHLMIHEGTHCFMMVLPGQRPPVWYIEGMAEYFGTHTLDEQGRATFGVMPGDADGFIGFGRVEMIRAAVKEDRVKGVAEVFGLTDDDFSRSRTDPYAWSWALCKFLDAHPRYQERFRALGQHLVGSGFSRLQRESFTVDLPVLAVEWELFVRNLEYGFDIPRSAIEFRRGEPLPAGAAVTSIVAADQGWQASGVWVEAGQTYQLTTEGEVTLASNPVPWLSEPQGISIRYSQGRPIGRVVAAIQSESPPGADGAGALWQVIDVGRAATVTPEVSGTVYLRVNDFWSELADNTGEYRVTIQR